MKKIIASLIVSFLVTFSTAQTASTYWIIFKDKVGSPYSIKTPETYLSEKAIARRAKQGIKIDVSDLPVNPNYMDGVRKTGATILNQSKWFNAVTIATADVTMLTKIKTLPFVKEIKLLAAPTTNKVSSKFELECKGTKSIPVKHSQSKSIETDTYDYGPSYKQAHQIGVDCLHNRGFHGEGITVAYFDAGFYQVDSLPAFDSMRVNNRLLGWHDFVAGGTPIYDDINTSHGMNTLSCSAGYLPGRIVGTAPKASFWLLRTEDVYSETLAEEVNWSVAAEFADSVGVDVINSSLGYSLFDNGTGDHTYADMDGRTTIVSKAAVWCARKGMFVTSSAGNSGAAPWHFITAPADADSILTVGAVDSMGVTANFSSRGPSYDGRIKPNTAARGVDAIVASPYGDVWGQNGTSFSSPITAGAVACLWQAHPSATVTQLIYSIERSATQFYLPDSLQGYGIPNFCVADSVLGSITGIDTYSSTNAETLTVYPNPFNDNFEIRFYSERKQNLKISLYDITGREVAHQEQPVFPANNSIHFSSGETTVSKGVYILRIDTTDKTFFKKLVNQ